MDFLALLKNKNILLFDGSLGTELQRRGLKSGELPDEWNYKRPDIVKELFSQYYAAGSDLVQTATFRSNGVALKGYGISNEDSIIEINEAAGSLLREVCPDGKIVVGDLGPSGEFLPPVGKGNILEINRGFELQVEVLNSYVDAWHLETFSDIQEMITAVEVVQSTSSKPIIASMTYNKTPKGFYTVMGNSLQDCFSRLKDIGVSVVGANCTLGSEQYIELAKALRAIDEDFPISLKPNAGQPELKNGMAVYKQPPEDFARDLGNSLRENIQVIGGCCGTQPIHIKLLRKKIDTFLKER